MQNIGGGPFASLRLVIGTTAAEDVDYVVDSSEETIERGTVSSGNPAVVTIPSDLRFQVTDSEFSNREKGIHVYTTSDSDLFVIVENFVNRLNHGAFLAYPCITIEADGGYEYYIISKDDPTDFLHSQFLLVGCEDDTAISVTPTRSISIPEDPQTEASALLTVDMDVASHEIKLNQMQTLLVSSVDDLSGTKIVSDKPLTVISGHECINVPSSESGCEPIAVHVPPKSTWGTKFLLAPFAGRTVEQNFKAISTDPTSIIYTCGTTSRGAQGVTSIEINTDEYCYLESSEPLLLVQLSVGGSSDSRGDPAIALVSPIDQYVKEIEFFTLQADMFASSFISVTVSAEHYNAENILLDGVAIDCEWKEIMNNNEEIVGYGCSKEVSSEEDAPKQHTVSHTDAEGRVSVLVYGFNTLPDLGYAYLAGQRITVTDGKRIILLC